MISSIPSPSPLNRLTFALQFRAKSNTKAPAFSARLDDSKNSANQQLNLSVLRFTLGISLSLWKLVLSKGIDNLGIWEQVIFFSVTFRRNMGCRDSWVG